MQQLMDRDLACIWHPFTQGKKPSIPIVKGSGTYLYADNGRKYLDAISSWWVNLHGHGHPYIAEKIAQQAKKLEQVIFAGYTHPQAIIFAERLLSLFSEEYGYVFYSDNGSTAVEVALKIALQLKGGKVLSFKNSYHGDTFGAMSAAGHSPYHKPFWSYLFQVASIPAPIDGYETESWKAFLSCVSKGEVTAFIFEPLVQGAGGMIPYRPNYLNQMIEKCHQLGIITIADEVMTGFGRTGPVFACDHLTTSPDLIALSKGITGGFLPMGATIIKKKIFQNFSEDPTRTFLHSHSYTANPLACAAANASLDLLLTPACICARKMIEAEHRKFQKKWKDHERIKRCDIIGTILAVEYNATCSLREKILDFFIANDILIRPLGNVLYILPPYCISAEELQKIYTTIIESFECL